MTVITWIVEGSWPACVDAARRIAPAGADIVLLHIAGDDVPAAAHGAYAGLLGRGRPGRDPGSRLAELGAASVRELLEAAAGRAGGPCTTAGRHGRAERAGGAGGRSSRRPKAAAEGADLLILARDGDDTRLGPRSLSPASRFVVDHAPCPVLLVWPARPLPPGLSRRPRRAAPAPGEPRAGPGHPSPGRLLGICKCV
jgi:nucleotide-binding universal stress UspA family protein